MCHTSDLSSSARVMRASFAFVLVIAVSAGARSQGQRDGGEGQWPAPLTAALMTCAATQCAAADDSTCAARCQVARLDAPVCRQVDCGACLAGKAACSGADDCGERVCVLCGSPDEAGEQLGACRSPSLAAALAGPGSDVVAAASGDVGPGRVVHAEGGGRPSSWALYELKDRRYRVLLSGSPPAPERARPSTASVRDRVGDMGIFALIGEARGGGDDVLASIFAGGTGVDDGVLAALDTAATSHVVTAFPFPEPRVARTTVPALRDLDTGGSRALPPHAKRASTITARLGREALIDLDEESDTEHAARVLKRRQEAFQLCYESVLKSDAALAGRLVLDLEVGRDGRVWVTSLVQDEVDSPALSRCVLATLERIRFPAQPREALFLTASLTFKQRS